MVSGRLRSQLQCDRSTTNNHFETHLIYHLAMNAIPDQTVLTASQIDWASTLTEVNAWRGECMHHFSAIEQAVTLTLLALDGAKPSSSTIRLRHLIGQRFEDLGEAIKPDGPFAEIGKTTSKTLAHYRQQHEAFRTQLCHGHITVAVVPNGHWLLVIRTLSIRSRQADSGLIVIEKPDALRHLEELKRDGQKLASALGQMRKAVVGPLST
ncbi:MAG: hypothetical protein R3E21_05450 [Caenibius sp.]